MSKPIAKTGNKNAAEVIAPAARPVSNRVLVWLLAGVALLAYINTLQNDFVLDDQVVITSNFVVKSGVHGIGQALTTPYHYGWNPAASDKLYRPLSLVVFQVLYQFFELNPLPYHLVNVLLFAGCVLQLFRVLSKVFNGQRMLVAFITALLFALHPIHTEVVANIKSCDELLCFFFSFASLDAFLSFTDKGKKLSLLWGCASLLIAVMAKETAYTFVGIIPFILLVYRSTERPRVLQVCAGIAAVAAVCLLARWLVLHNYHTTLQITESENLLVKPVGFGIHTATICYILGWYLLLLLVPYPLLCDYTVPHLNYMSWGSGAVIASAVAYLLITAAGIWRFRNNRKDPYALGIFFFLGTLFIFSNIPFLVGAAMAERFLFFCSVGFCLVVALLLERVTVYGRTQDTHALLRTPRLLAALLPLCVIYLGLTLTRNTNWLDNTTLYEHDLQQAPDDSRLNYYLGDKLLDAEEDVAARKQKARQAIDYLATAVRLNPDYWLAECDLGIAYGKLVMADSAEFHYLRTLALNPNASRAEMDMGRLRFFQKRYHEAIGYNRQLLRYYPDDAELYTNIGACYNAMQQYDSSIAINKLGTIHIPNNVVFYKNIAYNYKLLNNADSARRYDSIVVEMGK